MANATIRYPQNSEYYYYKLSPGGTKKYFSVDGKSITKKDIEKIEEEIQNYDPLYALYFLKKELERLTKEDKMELQKRKNKWKHIVDSFSEGIPSEASLHQKNNTEHYYIKNGIIYDYRKYISDSSNEFLKKLGEPPVHMDNLCTFIPIEVEIFKIKELDAIKGEIYSKTNIVKIYNEQIKNIREELLSLEKKRKEILSKLHRFPHISLKDIEKLTESFHRELEFLNKIQKDVPPPSFKKTGDILLDLGITDRNSFKIWVKKNHPDRHQSSKKLEEITKQFMRVTEAARKKGYLGNGGKP